MVIYIILFYDILATSASFHTVAFYKHSFDLKIFLLLVAIRGVPDLVGDLVYELSYATAQLIVG